MLLGAVVAGAVIWVAAQVHRDSTGGYWAELALIAAAGLMLALSRLLVRRGGSFWTSRSTLALAFLPALVAGGWVMAAAQPHTGWLRSHVLSWSDSIGLEYVVSDLRTFAPVLAFAVGTILGLVFERAPVAAPATAGPAPTKAPAREPVREPATAAPPRRTAERQRQPVGSRAGRDVGDED